MFITNIDLKSISSLFSIPYNTLLSWSKTEKENWRYKLISILQDCQDITTLTLDGLNKVFTKKDFKIITESLKGEKIDKKFYEDKRYLSWIVVDYCEKKEIDLIYQKELKEKIDSLVYFDKYLLLKHLSNKA